MKWTDLFIRRPVLALVVSALILVFGLKSASTLPVNQYPQTQNAIVTITTAYFGADPETIAGFITQLITSHRPALAVSPPLLQPCNSITMLIKR
jgi:multidrug efflux pump subunit AcrB